jgi:hypothetical protein
MSGSRLGDTTFDFERNKRLKEIEENSVESETVTSATEVVRLEGGAAPMGEYEMRIESNLGSDNCGRLTVNYEEWRLLGCYAMWFL